MADRWALAHCCHSDALVGETEAAAEPGPGLGAPGDARGARGERCGAAPGLATEGANWTIRGARLVGLGDAPAPALRGGRGDFPLVDLGFLLPPLLDVVGFLPLPPEAVGFLPLEVLGFFWCWCGRTEDGVRNKIPGLVCRRNARTRECE